jgi:hypothetical protein
VTVQTLTCAYNSGGGQATTVTESVTNGQSATPALTRCRPGSLGGRAACLGLFCGMVNQLLAAANAIPKNTIVYNSASGPNSNTFASYVGAVGGFQAMGLTAPRGSCGMRRANPRFPVTQASVAFL